MPALTTLLATVMIVCLATPLAAQNSTPITAPATAPAAQTAQAQDAVAAQIQELRLLLDAMRQQLADSRGDSDALRREVQELRERLDALTEGQELTGARVEQQEQTKVESGSKYHVRLSGLALLNVVSTRGSTDSVDLPALAQPREPGDSGGSFGAGVRQSLLNLEVFGPALGEAKTTGDLTLDFFGGFPGTSDGVSSPLVRLRTAKITLDWPRTSVVVGQDVLFFSPRSPTSLASTAYPALSSSGNLWAWTPQVQVEHRIALSSDSTMTVQWGILDPLTGELPNREYSRMPTAGERSRLPAEAVRVGWRRSVSERTTELGAGAYYSSQDWGFGRSVGGWAATADWDLPFGRWFAWSGEIYRGRAMAGLGGGVNQSVLFDGPSTVATSAVVPLDAAGGWFQLKGKPASRLEFNAAFGQDTLLHTPAASVLAAGGVDGSVVTRNASGFVNAIYQIRSNILFSVEYRRLWTSFADDTNQTADHVSVSAGIGF